MSAEVYAFPASFAQRRLWFLDQMEPGSPAYNIPAVLRLSGRLDVDALGRALNELVRRHESLRTTFGAADGQPVQLIAPALKLELPLVNLGRLPAYMREAEAHRLTAEESRRPFDLARGPLLRATLLRLTDGEHMLVLFMHHIISDGWSIGVLFRELTALYGAFSEGRPSPLAELPIQYADFTQWQREWLQGEVLETQIEYHRRQLEGAPALLTLPADRPRPSVQSFRGAVHTFDLSASLATGLRALSRREGATLFMTMLAGFEALLGKWTGQRDMVVGTPVANRGQAELEGLIGFFINTLALRADLSGDPTFTQLLGRVRETCLGAYAHQDVPFERLVEELQPERSLSHNPVFQVMFILQNTPRERLSLPGLSLHPIIGEGQVSLFDMTLSIEEQPEGLKGVLQYNTDIFDAATIERMSGHYRALLESVVEDPSRPLSELDWLTEGERRTLLRDFNDTPATEHAGALVHQLFERQAAATPDADALIYGGERLTYAELNARAERLARRLRTLGVGPESLVGVCMERTPALLVALLGVLKAGGAYVPLDPEYPKERIAFMLEDSRAGVLLTQTSLVGTLPAHAAHVICLDAEADAPEPAEAGAAAESNLSVQPGNLAYVIYTSGSTGRPKGVAITHSSVCVLAGWARRTFEPAHLARVLASTSVCFDLSVFELFATLAAGGAVVMAPDALALAGMTDAGVTLLNTVPSAARELVRSNSITRSVRCVVLCGEELPADLAADLYALDHVEQVWNLYGPTEDTVYSTMELVPRGGKKPLIGRGIDATQVYVLDARMKPVAVGVLGELYLGGAGLSRGYLGRPALTAERFVPDPYSTEPGARLYRTGDSVRWLADGRAEYLGRLDHQVKVRGYRIELGEIESALRDHAQVENAVAVVREDEPGDKRIVAYITGAGVDAGGLKARLRERLPEYMVPSAFVVMEELPRTPNGKIDRKALPAPAWEREEGEESYVAPRTAVEEVLAGLWCDVLRVERVGRHDNFFELGGHSLLAIQLVSRIREALKAELPVRLLFEASTVAALAERIEAAAEGSGGPAPAVVPVARGAESELSFAQWRLWLLNQLEPDSPAYNLSAAMRLDGRLDVEALRRAFDEVVRRHESLRTSFAATAGEPAQRVSDSASLRLRVEDLSSLPEEGRREEALRRAAEDARLPFDLASPPLMRAALLRLAEEEHVLLFTMHHIISDGWSIGVLLRELSALYGAYASGGRSPLAELRVQYADYAAWQREQLSGERLTRQLAYWKRQLAGAPALLELPTDRPRPAAQRYRGARTPVTLPAGLGEELKRLSRREGVTLYMTLLAAFQTLLWRYTGQEEVVVGTPVANRERGELEGLVGFFVNTLALRADLTGDPTFAQLLGRVRETALDGYAHQDVPFERLVEELQPERSMSYNPLFQVMFSLQSGLVTTRELPGLRIAPIDVDGGVAKFDLTLYMIERGGELSGWLEYDTDLFDATTAERIVGHYRALLEAAAAAPGSRVSELPLLTQPELRQTLVEWNQTRADFPVDVLTHELFEEQARRTPYAVAAVCGAARVGYAELNRRANRLAHALVEQGVGPDEVVGLLARRGLDFLTAVLAVFKAGGAYLPLDPEAPRERTRRILEQSGAKLVLAGAEFAGSDAGTRTLPLEGLLRESRPDENPGRRSRPDNLAYVIYTSGSTGQPKGAMVEHRGMLNHLFAKVADLKLAGADVVAQNASQCFDISVWQMLSPLVVGGSVLIVDDETARDPSALFEEARRRGVTVLEVVPSLLRGLLDGGESPAATPLRLLVVTGEALPPELCRRWLGARPEVPLLNAYGPTECSDDVTHCLIAHPPARGVARTPIGRPVANMRMYVLDRRLRPVAVGVAGELCVGGVGVGRGYLRDPKRTAEVFVPDPFASEPGARLYRTGDSVRWLADGSLEFIGRLDHQVKVRGHRIELGEIESALRRDESVREAVVVAREEAGDKRLVAYVVAAGGADAAELRERLRARLPEYMVPAALVLLEELPLTANGKIDRKALPAPDWGQVGAEYVAPRTEVEEAMASIWSALLGVERVGVNDNFFDLGGHSILATQLAARVHDAFGVRLPLRTVFESPTVAGLTVAVAGALLESEEAEGMEEMLARLERLSDGEIRALLDEGELEAPRRD